jgi:hypothetical protein
MLGKTSNLNIKIIITKPNNNNSNNNENKINFNDDEKHGERKIYLDQYSDDEFCEEIIKNKNIYGNGMIIMNDTSGLYLKVPSDFNFIKVVQ